MLVEYEPIRRTGDWLFARFLVPIVYMATFIIVPWYVEMEIENDRIDELNWILEVTSNERWSVLEILLTWFYIADGSTFFFLTYYRMVHFDISDNCFFFKR